MTNMKQAGVALAGIFVVLLNATAIAGESITGSDFLSDYGKLEAREMDSGTDYVHIAPGTLDSIGKYRAVMIDQPEIFVSADSKYKGLKPDSITAMSEIIRAAMIDTMVEGGYQAVQQPGPNVLYIRLALSDLYLKKKKRGILSFTPVGALVHAGSQALTQDAMKKMDIIEMSLEAEFIDSASGDTLAAMVVKRGGRKDKKTKQKEQRISFPEFSSIISEYAGRIVCRLDNAKLTEAEQVDCAAPVAATPQ